MVLSYLNRRKMFGSLVQRVHVWIFSIANRCEKGVSDVTVAVSGVLSHSKRCRFNLTRHSPSCLESCPCHLSYVLATVQRFGLGLWQAATALHAHSSSTPLSAQTAEWYVHKDLCNKTPRLPSRCTVTFKPYLPLSRILSPQLTALGSAQFPGLTAWPGATRTCSGGWHLWRSNPGPYGLVA